MHTSLVIPTLDGMPLLEQVLAMVDRQPGAAAVERIAVDSGSRDGTVDCLRRHGFVVHGIRKAEFNHGATRDLGISIASGEIVLLLTQDAIPADERWLPLLAAAYADPKVGAAYCRQIPRPDCNPFLAQRLREWTAGKTEPSVQQLDDPARFAQLEPLQRLHLCAYDNVAGSVRRAAWEQHRFGWRRFGEDVAFGKRLILDGWRIVFEPRSAVIHSHNRPAREEGRRIYCDHQNLKELFGVHLVPTARKLRENAAWAVKHYGETVAAMDLPRAEKRRLHRWAVAYARWAAFGMFLGGNADRLTRGPLGSLFRGLDRWMHRGI